jgi:type VI protein secretion system component VasF
MSTPERPDLAERPSEAEPGPPAEKSPLWLKLAVALVALVVVFLGLEVYRMTTSTSIGAVAADFCQTKSEIRASIVKVQSSTTDTELQQNSQEALAEIGGSIDDLRDEARRAGAAGAPTLGVQLNGLADAFTQLRSAIQALDPQAAAQAESRVIAAIEAVQTDPDIHSRCA